MDTLICPSCQADVPYRRGEELRCPACHRSFRADTSHRVVRIPVAVVGMVVVAALVFGAWYILENEGMLRSGSQDPPKAHTGPATPVRGQPLMTNVDQEQDSQLVLLRGAFRSLGPKPEVLAQASDLRKKFPKDAKIAQLTGDIEKAGMIKKAVPAPPSPKDLGLPFTELMDFVKHLNGHLRLHPGAGAELKDWIRGFRQRCIAPVRKPTFNNLAGLWQQLDRDIPAMAKNKLEVRKARLELLELSRGRLAGIFKDARHAKELDDRVPMAAVTGRLAQCNGRLRELEIRSRFHIDGPGQDVLEAAKELWKEFPEDTEIKHLVRDLGIARGIPKVVGMPPTALNPPFDEVMRFIRNLDKKLQMKEDAGPELRHWIGTFRQEHIVTVRKPAIDKIVELWLLLNKDIPPMDKRDLKDRKARLELLELSRTRLVSIFKDIEDVEKELDNRVPMAAITARLAQCDGRREELEIHALIKAHQDEVRAVTSLANWKRQQQGLQKSLAAMEKEVLAWCKKFSLDIAPLSTHLAANGKQIENWRVLESGISECVETFARRELAKTHRALAAVERDYSHAVVSNCRTALDCMQRGFEALLNRLTVAEARSQFERAKDHIYRVEGTLGPGGKYVAACLARISKLEKHVDQMAAVPANEIQFHDGKRVKVESLYIDCCEVSNKNFIDFLKGMASYRHKWPDLKKRYPGMWTTKSRFERALGRLDGEGRQKSDLLPVDGVSYYEAIAFVRSRGKDLPTWEEWWLAAKGAADANVPRFPWGDQMAKVGSDKELNQYNTPVDVNSGGECHRDKSIHHLAGNMAEWLRVEDVRAQKYGRLIGGSYVEVGRARPEQLRIYAGEKCLRAELWKKEEGFGFRGVLRPRAYFVDLIPVKD